MFLFCFSKHGFKSTLCAKIVVQAFFGVVLVSGRFGLSGAYALGA
jgi:hypothetical protein